MRRNLSRLPPHVEFVAPSHGYNTHAVPSPAPLPTATLSRRFGLGLIVWLAMLGLDFLLNGALFARMYQQSASFFLKPAEAFRRIPLGYLAFLVLAFCLVEIVHRLGVKRTTGGIRLGLVIGVVFGATWALSLYSIATLGAPVALAFAAIWIGLLTLATAVAASGLARRSLRGLALSVVGFDVLCVGTVIALQSSGVVPTITP